MNALKDVMHGYVWACMGMYAGRCGLRRERLNVAHYAG